jgi:hypothetical protein
MHDRVHIRVLGRAIKWGVNGGLYCATTFVPEDYDQPNFEVFHGVHNTANHRRRQCLSSRSDCKYFSTRLIERRLRGNARVRARKYNGMGFLAGSENRTVRFFIGVPRGSPGDVSVIAIH